MKEVGSDLKQYKELHEMINIGMLFEQDLKKAGINTPEDLYNLGSKGAFLKLKEAGVQNLNIKKLAGLEGAIRDCKKYSLDQSTQAEIEEFYNQCT